MPMMFGFADHRRQILEAEARRFAQEAPPYGAMAAWIVGDLARGVIDPETELELVIVQETDEPFQRRGEFWESHLRPRIGTRYLVYTPEEVDEFEESDPLLMGAMASGERIVG
ncbi:MAG: hypothetical protein AB7P40_29335 [Chloroflexota bacterium]